MFLSGERCDQEHMAERLQEEPQLQGPLCVGQQEPELEGGVRDRNREKPL